MRPTNDPRPLPEDVHAALLAMGFSTGFRRTYGFPEFGDDVLDLTATADGSAIAVAVDWIVERAERRGRSRFRDGLMAALA